jgi:O-antigen biosynthesis protein
MLLSIITPTHKPTYLTRLYESLKIQTCKDFEWVVVPNNNADVSFLPKENWIRVVPYSEESKLIGAIKNYAFNQGIGDWLAEVDHDDEVTKNCVEEILKAAKENICDFIYSDSIDLMPGNTANVFNSSNNWTYYPYTYKGIVYTINRTFLPTPQSVSRIWFAPNHIRVWNKDFYKRIGGHDKTLKALDDQDLMCRTYIEGKMYKIEKVLYAYYYHATNSFASEELNKWIQEYTLVLYEKYIEQMMRRWCKDNNLLIIDINKRSTKEGCAGINLEKLEVVRDNTVGLILADDALQLYKDPINSMEKIWRMLAHNGMLLSSTPSTDGRGAFQDPTHTSFWNANSFWYYSKKVFAGFINTKAKFQLTYVKDWCPSEFHKQVKIEYVIAHLTAIKNDNLRHMIPGVTEI